MSIDFNTASPETMNAVDEITNALLSKIQADTVKSKHQARKSNDMTLTVEERDAAHINWIIINARIEGMTFALRLL